MKKPRVVLLQTAIGDYRQEVLSLLAGSDEVEFRALAGPVYFDGTTLTRVDLGDRLKPVRNHFLLGRKLLWQTGQWRDVLRADAAIIEYNPRILSNWLLLAARKLLRRRSAVWGHAWPRAGRGNRTKGIRKVMAKLADGIIVYTETQASELREYIPDARIVAAPNALYRKDQMKAVTADTGPADFIYVGRLVEAKKPELMVRAFIEAADSLPGQARLVIVGDGPERPKLERLAAATPGRIIFKGHVADWDQLREMYAASLASISPGYVGLSITQSFSFGVPMIVARDEPHAPEVEAAIDGENSIFFTEDDVTSLKNAMLEIWQNRQTWTERREAIATDCRERYSAEHMAGRLLEGVGIASPAETERERPDVAVGGLLSPLRNAVRSARRLGYRARLGSKLTLGDNTTIGKRASLNPPEFMRLGDNVFIGADFHLDTNLEAGSDILISSRVAFVGNDHAFEDPETTVYWAGRNPPATVVLEGDNLLGFGVTVIGNVRIGRGCIVGSGAVVTGDLPPNTVCVGVPARPIRERFASSNGHTRETESRQAA